MKALQKLLKCMTQPTAEEYNAMTLEKATRDLAKALADRDYIEGAIVGLERTLTRLNGESK
jgi:hypothetical protein